MSLKLKNTKALNKYIISQSDRIQKALIYQLDAFVTELQNHAKASAGYQDQTGNLKSSIGGAVVQDGRVVTYSGFEQVLTGSPGVSKGREYLNSLLGNYRKGTVLIVVAGMEYASFVQDVNDRNVLKKSELKMGRELPRLLKRIEEQSLR